MKSFPLKIIILYSDSEFTPWKENINVQTITCLIQALSLQHQVTITHFNCMEECFAAFLKRFDLVYNVCYGFDNYSQTDIVEWLDENRCELLPAEVGEAVEIAEAQRREVLRRRDELLRNPALAQRIDDEYFNRLRDKLGDVRAGKASAG